MIQILKYGLLIACAFLLHILWMQTDSYTRIPFDDPQEPCFVAQADAGTHSQHYHHRVVRYSHLSCEAGHIELSPLPSVKSFLRLPTRFLACPSVTNSPTCLLTHPSIYDSSGPVGYYIFGLRKIII